MEYLYVTEENTSKMINNLDKKIEECIHLLHSTISPLFPTYVILFKICRNMYKYSEKKFNGSVYE